MTYAHRLWIMIVRRTRHSVLLFLLVFCFSLLGIVSGYFRNIVESYQNLVVSDIGYSLMLYRTDEKDVSQDVIEQIEQLNDVVGCNQEFNMLVQPSNFMNAISYNAGYLFDIPKSDMVRLYADSNTELNITFANHMQMIEGIFPSYNNTGAIIDTVLASKNNLGIGDIIIIKHPESNSEYSFPIIGIYKTTSLPQESWEGANGNIEYGQSPYSYIFCDITSFKHLLKTDLPLSSVIVYGKDKKSLDNISNSIGKMDFFQRDYRLINRTENKIKTGTLASRAISSAATVLTSITVSVSAFVLFMVVVLWMRSCYKDISILIALGEKRYKIASDYFLVISAIAISALFISLPLCNLIITQFGDRIVEHTFISAGYMSGMEIDNYMVAALKQQLEAVDYLTAQFVLLSVVWGASLTASINILKNKPSTLFNMT